MLVPSSSNVNFATFSTAFPSSCSILLSLAASVVLLCAFRYLFLWMSSSSLFTRWRQHAVSGKKQIKSSQEAQMAQRPSHWRFFKFENLNLPVSLTVPPNGLVVGKGVGLGAGAALAQGFPQPSHFGPAPQQMSQVNWQQPGTKAQLSRPPYYYSQEPASMAKMIMSRHTFRKPAPRPARRASSMPPPAQSQTKTQTMV